MESPYPFDCSISGSNPEDRREGRWNADHGTTVSAVPAAEAPESDWGSEGMKVRRVLRVADVPGDAEGGIAGYIRASSEQLALRNVDVTHLFREDLGLRFARRGARRLLVPLLIVLRVLRLSRTRGGPDLVEIHEPLGAIYALGRRLGVRNLPPMVVLSHGLEALLWAGTRERARVRGQPLSRKTRVLVPLTVVAQSTIALRFADAVVVLNTTDARYVRDHLHRDASLVHLAPGGASELFRRRGRKRSDASAAKVIFLGSWIDRKGTAELCEAWAAVSVSCPDAQLTLLGTGEDEPVVRADFGGANSVRVIPRASRERVLRELMSHDIFVLPSWFEGFPLATIEAASAGLACVVSRVPGHLDVFSNATADREAALLVPIHDARALAGALEQLLSDYDLRSRLGERARDLAATYTWSATARALAWAYETALQ